MSGTNSKYHIRIDDQVRLVPPDLEHVDHLVLYLNDEELYKNTLTVPFPYHRSDGVSFIEQAKSFESKMGFPKDWAIYHASDGPIGGIGILYNYGTDTHKSEIGYWIAKPYRGKGLLTRILPIFCDYLFFERKLIRLEACVFPHNPASKKVLLKCGFSFEGLLVHDILKDGELLDTELFAKIHRDYRE